MEKQGIPNRKARHMLTIENEFVSNVATVHDKHN